VKRLFAAGVTAVCAALVLPATAAEVRDGRIAFSGHDAKNHSDELYSMLPDGSDRVNLTRHFEGDVRGPRVYSPDGRWIAFGCTKPGDERAPFPTDVCVVKDGVKSPKPVRLSKLEGIERPSAFSPDSKWIAFSANDPSADSSVYVVRRNGRELTKLTDRRTPDAENPTFTPDGKRILFNSVLGKGGGGIYLMDADGSDLTLVIDQDTFTLVLNPSFSPDGTQILFFAFPPDEDDRELFVSDRQGGNIVRLSSDESERETTAGFSPDGELIAYAFGPEIWTVRPDGTDHVAIDRGDYQLEPAAWAPSSSRLVFEMKQSDVRGSEIGTAAPGGSPEPITDTDGITEELPIWARGR
jgi:Tol biopolymer transport system component